MEHTSYHWTCCWKPAIGWILWLLAAASIIAAWVAKDSVVLGYSGLGWYWNALVLGVLAIPLFSKRGCHGHCKTCGGMHGSCAGCEAGKCDVHVTQQ